MAKTYSVLFKVDGKTCISRAVEYPENSSEHLSYYYNLIECSCVDIVNAYGLRKLADEIKDESFGFLADICMVADDEALLKENPTVNIPASFLYGYADHGQPIFGNVLVCKNHYTPDGIETVGLTPEEIRNLEIALNILIEKERAKNEQESTENDE